MYITVRFRSAVEALLELDRHRTRGPMPLARMSERLEVSQSYLELICRKLREAGLIESVRGPNGGYLLARPLQWISVADVMSTIGMPCKSAQTKQAKRNPRTSGRGNGAAKAPPDLWDRFNAQLMTYLVSVSLGELLDQTQNGHASSARGGRSVESIAV